MLGSERMVVGGALAVLLIAALGFVFHADPRFPGSLLGSMIGAVAMLLFIAPLLYGVVKRVPSLRRWSGKVLGVRRLIVWHIYTSLAATALALTHAAHRYDSVIGVVLIGLLSVALASGYVGRHYYGKVAKDIREQQADLARLKTRYRELASQPNILKTPSRSFATIRSVFSRGENASVASLVGAIADTENSVLQHDNLKAALSVWLWLHIISSYAAFALMFGHLAIEIYLGFRWL